MPNLIYRDPIVHRASHHLARFVADNANASDLPIVLPYSYRQGSRRLNIRRAECFSENGRESLDDC